MKIGMIGFGNMAQAMVQGWLKTGVLTPEQISASAGHYEKLKQNAAVYGITPCKSNAELVETSDIVFLMVKPFMLESALADCTHLFADKMIVCPAAGIDYEKLEALLPGTHHISIMPNTAISVGQGIVIAQQKNSLKPDQMDTLEKLFEPVSLMVSVPDSQFSIAGTIAGCTPAFMGPYVEALSDAGVKYGLPRVLARELSAKAAAGAAAMILDGLHPAILKDNICSPAGTTIRGITELEKDGFRTSLIQAIEQIQSK